jgi:predicted glycosyltransferase involved in capsule biosynthesis
MSTEIEKKVENAMPKEDANNEQSTQTSPPQTSFVGAKPQEKVEEKKQIVTMQDVLMYVAIQSRKTNVLLESIRDMLEKTYRSQVVLERLSAPIVTPSVVATQPVANDAELDKVKKALVEFDALLTFNVDENNMFFIIKVKQFLGSDNFSKIASIIRSLGGEYVSQGKASHFKVPKGK